MKLTKKQRHNIYKKLLSIVCDDPRVDTGICGYLTFIELPSTSKNYQEWFLMLGLIRMKFLPELNKHKPDNFYNRFYWFPLTSKGWEKRIAIIQQAIKETEKNSHEYLGCGTTDEC